MKKIELTDEQRTDALMNAVPQKPNKHELGGGIYYTCHWVSCNETLNKWYNYCPKCGNRIDWGYENDFYE